MINLNFFPSRRLALYTAKLFLTRGIAVMFSLSLVLMMLNLLSESGKILAVPGNTNADVWHYVGLRLPQIVAFAFPFSFLLGTLIVFVTLNQNSEVIAMNAAGLSAHQVIAPLILTSVALAGISFAFNEYVVTRATAELSAWDGNDYKPLPPESLVTSNVWVTAGDDMVRADLVIGRGVATRLQGVRIYDRQGNSVARIITAERAVQEAGGWRLENVSVYDAAQNVVRKLPAMPELAGVEPGRFTLAKIDPETRTLGALQENIAELRAAGRQTDAVETGLWHKISEPLSTILMPLLAAVAAFGLARSGQVLARAAIGMALGFAYFVIDNFAVAMGNVGAYPPLLAAWAPFFLFLLIGETVLVRSEE
jgi:lipopolysaccharide export system permease protein